MKTPPADERLDALSSDGGHGHGHGLGCGQPVRVVVAGGEVADVVDVAEHEGHGAEPAQAAASCAWKSDGTKEAVGCKRPRSDPVQNSFTIRRTEVLSVSPFVALHVQQGVSVIDEAGSLGTEGHVLSLAVTGDEEAVGCRHRPWQTRKTLRTVGTRRTRVPRLTYDQSKGVN